MNKIFRFVGEVILLILFSAILIVCGSGGGGGGGSSNGGGGSTPEATATIGPSGGTVEVTNSSSPLYGVKIEIPAGALADNKTITISQVDSESSISETAVKVSKTISLGPKGTVFNTPVSITIPYIDSNVSDENSLQIYEYNGSSWEGVTFKKRDTTANTITALSGHFSDFVVLEPNLQASVDTGFKPGINGFSINNFGYPGNCAGMVSYAKWFFDNVRCDLYLYNAYDKYKCYS